MPSIPAIDRERLLARERLPGLLLVLLAVVLVAGAVWFVYADFRPTYQLTVTATGEAPADAEVLDYDALPPEAQSAFDAARDGPHVVHHDPAFRETFPLYETVYVRADGTVHELWLRGDGLNGLSLLLAVPTVVVALVLAGLGGHSYRRQKVRLPTTVLAGLGGAWLAGVASTLPGPVVLGRVGFVPVAVGLVAASVAAWVWLDRYDVA